MEAKNQEYSLASLFFSFSYKPSQTPKLLSILSKFYICTGSLFLWEESEPSTVEEERREILELPL